MSPPDTTRPADTVAASVVVAPANIEFDVGDTVTVRATVRNAGGDVLTGAPVTWSSVDPGIASVDGSGLVTGVGAGRATITAVAGAASGSAVATVRSVTGSANCTSPAPAWVWCDDFEVDRLGSYFEYDDAGGNFVPVQGAGLDGSTAMRAQFTQGQAGAGSLHLAIGRTPSAYFAPADAGTADYTEIYWRHYLMHEPGWTGGGGRKLSRAFIFAESSWAQAMIAHLWAGSAPDSFYLFTDPVSGTDAQGNVVTTQYNDFANFEWLGARKGITPLFADANVGRWYCIEAHVRLNDAGQSNGVFEFWIDGNLEASRTDLNFVDTYSGYGINAVYLENFWNNGAPRSEARYFDDFVVSTEPIGC
jgi:hypothetical protein